MRCLTSTKILVMSSLDCFGAEGRVKGLKAFQSSRICFEYSEKQIGFSHKQHKNLYNLDLLSNSSPAKTWLSTRNPHRYHFDGRSYSESKEPRFRLLEIEANAVIYIHPKFFK